MKQTLLFFVTFLLNTSAVFPLTIDLVRTENSNLNSNTARIFIAFESIIASNDSTHVTIPPADISTVSPKDKPNQLIFARSVPIIYELISTPLFTLDTLSIATDHGHFNRSICFCYDTHVLNCNLNNSLKLEHNSLVDTDGDGIDDEDDLDNDNDGITDADECSTAINYKDSFETPGITALGLGTDSDADGEFDILINQTSIGGWNAIFGNNFDIIHDLNNTSDGLQSIDLYGLPNAATIQKTFTGFTPGKPVAFSVDYSSAATLFAAGVWVNYGSGFFLIATLTPTSIAAPNAPGVVGQSITTVSWSTFSQILNPTSTDITIRLASTTVGFIQTGVLIDNVKLSQSCEDTDNDGLTNNYDLDSDNDGIFDAVESGHNQVHTNGIVNGNVGTDGIPDSVQSSPNNGVVNYTIAESSDDADSIQNFLDLDSDGDGIPDNVEAQTTLDYIAPSGVVNSNGVFSNYITGLNPTNTDGVDSVDYLDIDADNEGGTDTVEAGLTLSGNDIDNDGLDDGTDADITGYADPGGTIDDPLVGPVLLPDGDSDANTGGDVDFRDNFTQCFPGAGIIVNEASNGSGGSEDWIELLVVGDQANPTNPVDLTGWFIDDNNGDFEGSIGGVGIAQGSIVLGATFNSVVPGSLIVIYNQFDKDPNIPADDPTDSNNDNIYILPGNHSSLSGCSNLPSTSNTNYLPCTSTTASWSRTAFRNGGDAAQTRRPDGTFFHGYSYGNVTAPYPTFPCGGSSFNLGSGGAGSTFAFQCGDWEDASNFIRSNATGRTPGAVNSQDNQYFIDNVLAGSIDYSDLNSLSNCSAPADLSLSKGVNNSRPAVGDVITFQLVVTNDGPGVPTNIIVRDIIPGDFTYNHPDFTTTQGTVTFNSGTRAFEWNLGSYMLPVGSSISLTYNVSVDVCGQFTNSAEIVNSSLTDSDSIANNNN